MNELNKLKKFLQCNYPNIQAFNCSAHDYKEEVYNADGIQVYHAPGYGYIEIFGLTDKQFIGLLDKKSFLGDHLKTFRLRNKE